VWELWTVNFLPGIEAGIEVWERWDCEFSPGIKVWDLGTVNLPPPLAFVRGEWGGDVSEEQLGSRVASPNPNPTRTHPTLT